MQKRIELNSPRQNEVKMRDALIWASLMGLPVMLCACVLSASGAEACDGEYVGGMGNWSSSASWKNGAKAAGAGAILTVRAEEKNAAGYFLSLDEDATVGHIVRPADCEQPEGLSSKFSSSSFFLRTATVGSTCALTLDSGIAGQPATIRHPVPRAKMNGKRFPLVFENRFVLRSDLEVSYEGVFDRICGNGWISGSLGAFPHYTVALLGDISEADGSHAVTLENPVYAKNGSGVADTFNPVLMTGNNTFTGDLTVRQGGLRVALNGAAAAEGSRISHALGRNNAIHVDNAGLGYLDLGGLIAGVDGNTLYLGGMGPRTAMGTLINMNPDPLAVGEWRGPLVIASETRLGGVTEAANGAAGGGNLKLSGAVRGSHDLHLISSRTVEFAGDFSNYSGDVSVESGYLRLGKGYVGGSGKIDFKAGSGYLFASSNDVDLTKQSYSTPQAMVLRVEEGVDYAPVQGLAYANAVYKQGAGTLTLKASGTRAAEISTFTTLLKVEDGTVVLDYSGETSGSKIGEEADKGVFHTGDRVRFVVRDDQPRRTAAHTNGLFAINRGVALKGQHVTLAFEGSGAYSLGEIWLDGLRDYENNEGSGVVTLDFDPAQWNLVNGIPWATKTEGDMAGVSARNVLWRNESWVKLIDEGRVAPLPASDYALDFTSGSGSAKPGYASVDVTAALCAESHADVSCGRLRFNTPNGGTPLALTLAGTNAIHGGMILVTPNMADTPVVIKGGTLVRQGCGGAADITIANFNTNATLTLDCDILGDVVAADGSVKTNASASVCFVGPGTTIVKGDLLVRGGVYVNGTRLQVGDGQGLLAGLSSTKIDGLDAFRSKTVRVSGGGLVEFTENGGFVRTFTDEPGSPANCLTLTLGASGGGIAVADGKTATYEDCTALRMYFEGARHFVKDGKGTFKIARANGLSWFASKSVLELNETVPQSRVSRFDVRAGTLWYAVGNGLSDAALAPFKVFGGDASTLVRLGDGAVLKGRHFLASRTLTANVPEMDNGASVKYVVDGGTATLDICDSSRPGRFSSPDIEAGFDVFGLPRARELLVGSGTLVLTNSASETVGLVPAGFADAGFAGRLELAVPLVTDGYSNPGGWSWPNAIVEIPAGRKDEFFDVNEPWNALRLGGLTGAGELAMTYKYKPSDAALTVGCDSESELDFAGTITLGQNGAFRGRLVKVGSNAQRLSGANVIPGAVSVEGGKMVLGHVEALSGGETEPILVGGARASSSPAVLVDCGTVTVMRPVQVLPSPEGVLPCVGAQSGMATFAQPLVVSNDCAVFAFAGAKAVFAGGVSNEAAHRIVWVGGGVVEIAGDLALTEDCRLTFGGTLAVNGMLSFADGVRLVLDGFDATKLDPNRRYVLVKAKRISGSLDVSGIDLPEGWEIAQYPTKVVLRRPRGVALLIR